MKTVFHLYKRNFAAKNYDKGSMLRNKLNENIETSEYMTSYKYAVVENDDEGNIKSTRAFKTKELAQKYIEQCETHFEKLQSKAEQVCSYKMTEQEKNTSPALDDETFYLNELNHFTKIYFEYLVECRKEHDKETQDYLEGFTQYCKDYIYYYSAKLVELKKEN